MIMCVLLCYPLSIHMSQLLSTGRPISSFFSELQKMIESESVLQKYLQNEKHLGNFFLQVIHYF